MSQATAELPRAMFHAAVASAQPAVCVPPHLAEVRHGRLVVLGAGKGSAAMAHDSSPGVHPARAQPPT